MKYPFKTEVFREQVIIRELRDEMMELIGFECLIRDKDHNEYSGTGPTVDQAFLNMWENNNR